YFLSCPLHHATCPLTTPLTTPLPSPLLSTFHAPVFQVPALPRYIHTTVFRII
ncbi:hypothetical protein BDN70DRAFT_887240, partial [Pholiota conissans]